MWLVKGSPLSYLLNCAITQGSGIAKVSTLPKPHRRFLKGKGKKERVAWEGRASRSRHRFSRTLFTVSKISIPFGVWMFLLEGWGRERFLSTVRFCLRCQLASPAISDTVTPSDQISHAASEERSKPLLRFCILDHACIPDFVALPMMST